MLYDSVKKASSDLQAIISRINKNLTDQETEAIQDELAQYLNALPAGSPEFAEFDRVADETYEQLYQKLTNAALDRLRTNRRFLVRHTETLGAITTKAAASIQRYELSVVKRIGQFITSAVEIADEVRDAIREKDLLAAEQKIRSLIKMVRELNPQPDEEDSQ